MKNLSSIVLIIAVALFAVTGCAKPSSHAAGTSPRSDVSSSSSSAVSLPSSVSSASSPASSSSSAPSSSASNVPVTSSSDAAGSSPAKQAQTVSVTIDGTKGGGTTDQFTVELQDGDTVFTVLLRACGKNSADKSNVSSTGKGGTTFVTAIFGVANSNFSTDGWVYTVNGSKPDISCGAYPVKNGDKIQWTFSTSGY